MLIEVNDKYRLSSDPLNFIIEEKRVIKPKYEGVEPRFKWVRCGYYPNLKSAYNSLIKRGIAGDRMDGLKKVVECMDQAYEKICEAIDRADINYLHKKAKLLER